MKRIGIAGLLVVMAIAVSGVSAGSASAGGICLATFFGLYTNDSAIGTQCKNNVIVSIPGWSLFRTTGSKEISPGLLCALVEAGEPSLYDGSSCGTSEEHHASGEYAKALLGPYLLNSSLGVPAKSLFTGTSKESVFETKSGESVKCKADTVMGNLTGASTDEAEVKFTGCTAVGGLLKCKTTGSASGEIVLKENSRLVWLNEAKQEPGEAFSLPSTLTIECTGLASETLEVRGGTICATTKALSKKATVTCKQTKGVQEPTEYELGGSKFKLITETEGKGTKAFPFEQSGLNSTDELEFEEEVEVVA
jgi:hypothetical protein